jgi:hypothetical protein
MTPQRPPTPARRRPRNDARSTKASGEAVEKAENGRVIPLSAPPASDGPAQGTDRPGDNSKADGHGPARGYSWPPFAKGDRAALVHGGYSERSVAERAEGALIVQRADRRLAAVPTAVPTERGTQT